MRRRDFIKMIGGGAAAWPLVARAQQGERMRRIGVLLPATADDKHYQIWLGAFLQGLAQAGWNIGQNVQIDIRWGDCKRRRRPQERGRAGWRSRPMSSSAPAPPPWGLCDRRPARCRLYSRWSRTPSAPVS